MSDEKRTNDLDLPAMRESLHAARRKDSTMAEWAMKWGARLMDAVDDAPTGDMIYLASPYSHDDPQERVRRFHAAAKAASDLMRSGRHVFCPIAHTHPIALFGLPFGWEFWEQFDRWYISRCSEVRVLMLDGWRESKGVAAEIAIAEELGKPIMFVCAGDVCTESVDATSLDLEHH